MIELQISWAWVALIALGAFHGLNPAMGWLFAVARGFQEKRSSAMFSAFGPITLGHALAIGVVAVPMGLLGLTLPRNWMQIGTGLLLIGFAAYRQFARIKHPRWIAMRVRPWELMGWSFLMATSHGAGLMLAPLLARTKTDTASAADPGGHVHQMGMDMSGHEHAGHLPDGAGEGIGSALMAVTLHSAAMLLAGAAIAFLVYRLVGVEGLRRYWINLDLVWVVALFVTGGITLTLGVWSVV